jgi:hypothetical protein
MKAIICNDLAFCLGEWEGMSGLLHYLFPSGYTIPSHQTV